MAKFMRSDWSVGVARSCMCHAVSPGFEYRIGKPTEYLTVKIKEDFELVIEVRVFLCTIIKLVSCPVFAFS